MITKKELTFVVADKPEGDTVRVSIDIPRAMHERIKTVYPRYGFIKGLLTAFFANMAQECDNHNWTCGNQQEFLRYVDRIVPGFLK